MRIAKSACVRLATFGLLALATAAAGGCQGTKLPPSYVENVAVRYSFTNVDKPEERARVYEVAKSIAEGGTLSPTDVPSTPTFDLTFKVKRLSALDEAHPRILFVGRPGGKPEDVDQLFNSQDPAFSIRYDTINIGGGIEVIVRFRVTPGATLVYKPQGGAIEDITAKVGPSGDVAFSTRINKGQEFFYARAISGGVTKWLKINVFTQEVKEISQAEFDEGR